MPAIPEVIFQHFRNPQNNESIKSANGEGAVDGRSKDSKLRFFLKIKDDGSIEKATFQSLRDRASNAALSMVTVHITGRPIAEVEGLTLEQIGVVYGLAGEYLPMLIPAFEAMQAAIANYRGLPNPYAFEGGMVCTCLSVREGRIRRAIQDRGLKTLKEIQLWTRACTGCRSCRPDVQRILMGEIEV